MPQRRRSRPIASRNGSRRQPVKCQVVVFICSKRLVEACQRLSVAMEANQCIATPCKNVRVIGPDGECAVVYGNRRFFAVERDKAVAMVDERLAHIRA